MKMILVIMLALFSVSAYAEETRQLCCHVKQEAKPEPKPKVIYKTKWKTKVVEKKVQVKDPCCQKPGHVIHQSKTGNQKVIVNVPKQRDRLVVVKYRTRYKRKKVKVDVTNPNRLQLMLGFSNTMMKVHDVDCCDVEVTKEHELDVGLQYTRDLGGFSGSLMGTVNRNFYMGLGLNW